MSQRQAPRLLRAQGLRSLEVFDPWDTRGPLSEDLRGKIFQAAVGLEV